jgi:heptosyltransferase III
MPDPGRILVIRGGAIGDFILTLPVLAALRRHLPQAGLEVLGYGHIARLARLGGLADAVHSIEAGPLAGFFAREADLHPQWKDFFARFAVVISFLYDPDGVFQENLARCSSAQYIAGPHRPDESAGLPAARALLKPLERLAIFEADPVPRLRIAARATGSPEGARPVLALHPGSGSERKNWPETRWAELFRVLGAAVEHDFLVVGGEAEGARLQRLASLFPATRAQMARSLPLEILAQRLGECAAFVGHDSGISHLAAALGVPVLALWGDTAESVWRPQGEQVRILRAPGGLAQLPVQTVLEAIRALVVAQDSGPQEVLE